MSDFTEGFSTGFSVVSAIKEKQKAKKAIEELQTTLQDWKDSGYEPTYVDKLMMGVTAQSIGSTYAQLFNTITNSKDSYDQSKMEESALTLRKYNDSVLDVVKSIQTAAKENTLDLLDWQYIGKTLGIDLSSLTKEKIAALKSGAAEEKQKEQNIDIYGKTPTEYKMGVGERLGVVPEGVQPTTTPKTAGISDYNGAANYLSKFVNAAPDTFNKVLAGLQKQFPNIDMSGITQESLKTPEKPTTTTKPKVIDPNDVLFGTNGIMKNYINSGSQLGDEQKTEIRNNYNLIKPSLSADVRTQVEDYLKQIGIDVNAVAPIPEPTPEPTEQGGGFHPITAVKNWLGMKGTPPQQGQQDYTAMNDDQLADLALTGDQAAIDELKRRGLL